jgi:hypothetical protein
MRSRWLIFAPVAALAWVSPVAAEPAYGLSVIGYTIDQIPPVKADDIYPVCGQGTLDFINATWDYAQNEFGACGGDQFMLHYSGSIQIPEHQTIEFWLASDDGGTAKIGVHEWGTWADQGCSASESGLLDIAAGIQPIDAWFYENGGGTCFMLAWNIDSTGWAIVPPEAFTSIPVDTTTTTELTTTTVSTTTLLAVSTSVSPPISQVNPVSTTTTSDQPTTTTSTTTTTTTVYVPTYTTTAETTTTTEPEPTTTTTEMPISTTTVEPSTTTTEYVTTSTETVTTEPEPVTTEPEIIEPVDEITPAIVAALSAAITELTEISPEQVTVEQISQIVESAAFDDLSDEQLTVLAEIISDAPDEVKDEFESAVNVFDDPALSAYVPKGSSISVGSRRVMIAVTAVSMAMAVPTASTTSAERRQKLR